MHKIQKWFSVWLKVWDERGEKKLIFSSWALPSPLSSPSLTLIPFPHWIWRGKKERNCSQSSLISSMLLNQYPYFVTHSLLLWECSKFTQIHTVIISDLCCFCLQQMTKPMKDYAKCWQQTAWRRGFNRHEPIDQTDCLEGFHRCTSFRKRSISFSSQYFY